MMSEENKKKSRRLEKTNVVFSFLQQFIATACGVVIPRVMIGAFGSVVYGATVSIAQMLSCISLLESGIGGVARGALYKGLAEKDNRRISTVYQQIQRFFRKIGLIFLVYAVFLAIFYYDIAEITAFDRRYTFGLVCVICLSTFANYMFGITNMTLLHADRKQYITNSIIAVTNVINTVSIVVLVWMKSDVLSVKLFSSLIFITRPLLYGYFVKKQYHLEKVPDAEDALEQKWTGMGQHIAYFLHTNTDIVLLTLFADLKYVAVYSVYSMVIKSIWNIASSFSGGMEASFGSAIGRNDRKEFRSMYARYKVMLTMVSIVMFGTASVLLEPFIGLYTADIADANYTQPLFGLILLMAEGMNCIALPCYTLPISANRLKQTRWGSYLEAVINISVSLLLIWWNPLLGVALGTLAATAFKCIYYIIYAGRHFLCRRPMVLVGQFLATVMVLLLIWQGGRALMAGVVIGNYLVWGLWGVAVVAATALIALLTCKLLFPREVHLNVKGILRLMKRSGR